MGDPRQEYEIDTHRGPSARPQKQPAERPGMGMLHGALSWIALGLIVGCGALAVQSGLYAVADAIRELTLPSEGTEREPGPLKAVNRPEGATMRETTLAIIKPDAVRDGHALPIMAILSKTFTVTRTWAGTLSPEQVNGLYREHKGKPFYPAACARRLATRMLPCRGGDAGLSPAGVAKGLRGGSSETTEAARYGGTKTEAEDTQSRGPQDCAVGSRSVPEGGRWS